MTSREVSPRDSVCPSPLKDWPDDDSTTLTVALVYEDLSCGLRAKQLLDGVAGILPRAPRLGLAVWRFDLLRDPSIRAAALDEAFTAELLLVSARGSADLPRSVAGWIQEWLDRKSGDDCALVVSLDAEFQESTAALRTLSSLGADALVNRVKGVDVFPHFGLSPEFGAGLGLDRPDSLLAQTRLLSKLQGWPELQSHWGVNE